MTGAQVFALIGLAALIAAVVAWSSVIDDRAADDRAAHAALMREIRGHAIAQIDEAAE